MLDIEIEDRLVAKVGGKLRLTALMQKRMVELKRGARPLVDARESRKDLLNIVVQEILEGKIELADREVAQTDFLGEMTRRGAAPTGEPGDEREIYGSDIKKIKEQRIKELSALLNPTKK